MIAFGSSVVAIAATEPMAHVHMMPDAIMYTEHSTRSAVFTGVYAPYPIEVSVITLQ